MLIVLMTLLLGRSFGAVFAPTILSCCLRCSAANCCVKLFMSETPRLQGTDVIGDSVTVSATLNTPGRGSNCWRYLPLLGAGSSLRYVVGTFPELRATVLSQIGNVPYCWLRSWWSLCGKLYELPQMTVHALWNFTVAVQLVWMLIMAACQHAEDWMARLPARRVTKLGISTPTASVWEGKGENILLGGLGWFLERLELA